MYFILRKNGGEELEMLPMRAKRASKPSELNKAGAP